MIMNLNANICMNGIRRATLICDKTKSQMQFMQRARIRDKTNFLFLKILSGKERLAIAMEQVMIISVNRSYFQITLTTMLNILQYFI